MRTTRPAVFLLALVLAAPVLSGCLYSREVAQTRRAIEQAYPEARFEREMVLSLGPVSLFALRLFSGLAPEGARGPLRDLRRVKVGVYRAEALPPLQDFEPAQVQRLQRRGWETVVRTREADEATWVLYRTRRGTVRDLYVIALDDEELVLTRLSGRLDRLLARAFREEGALDWDRLGAD